MPKQILLVEDSVTMQKVVEITFAHEDYRIASARDADEALARVRDLRPDVVLADAGLPGRSGYDLCAVLKGDGASKEIPILLLTSNFNPYDEVRGQKVGVDAHVVKPFETQVLIDKVADLLRRRGTQQPQMPTLVAVPQMADKLPPPAAEQSRRPAASSVSSVPTAPSVPPRTSTPSSQMPTVSAAAPPPTSPAMPSHPPGVRPPATTGEQAVQRSTLMGIPAVNPLGGPGLRPPPPPGMRVRETGNLPAINPPGIQAGTPMPLTGGPAAPPASTGGLAAAVASGAPTGPMQSWTGGGRPPEARSTVMQGSTGLSLTASPMAATLIGQLATPAAPQTAQSQHPAPAQAPAAPVQPHAPAVPAAGIPAVVPQMPRPSLIPRAPIPQAVLATLERIAQRGAEYEAIAKLSLETIEQIVWEVVPELAEVIIRAELDRLIKERETKG